MSDGHPALMVCIESDADIDALVAELEERGDVESAERILGGLETVEAGEP